MPDHIITSHLVCDGSFLSALPLFKTGQEVRDKITPILLDTMAGVNFLPSALIKTTYIHM